jgi:Fe2+ or Zn2+ uptake regulation protein
MSETEIDLSNLRTLGYRLTPQRLAILRILREADQHFTPVEVFQRARSLMPGLTEATVYRSLDFLARHGLAMEAYVGSGQVVYESSTHHHHHLICRDCGSILAIDHEALAALYAQLQAITGYKIDTLHVTFFGLCPDCQKTT